MFENIRFESPMQMKLLQLAGVIVNGYYLIYMAMLNVWFGQGLTPFAIWKSCLFLTNINHILIFIYHLWSFLTAHKGLKRSQSLQKYYQFLFNLSALVSLIYWMMRSIDQRLIHGKHTAEELGEVYFIFIHGINHFLLFLEILIENKQNQFKSSVQQFAGFILGYSLLSAFQQFYFGKHIYAFYKLINPFGFLVPLLSIPALIAVDKFYTLKIFAFFSTKSIEDNSSSKLDKSSPSRLSTSIDDKKSY